MYMHDIIIVIIFQSKRQHMQRYPKISKTKTPSPFNQPIHSQTKPELQTSAHVVLVLVTLVSVGMAVSVSVPMAFTVSLFLLRVAGIGGTREKSRGGIRHVADLVDNLMDSLGRSSIRSRSSRRAICNQIIHKENVINSVRDTNGKAREKEKSGEVGR